MSLADITRRRGDTYPHRFTLIDSNGAAVNIAGYSFRMTVNTVKKPVDISTQLFTLTGVITAAAAGEYEFRPSSTNTDQTPGTYWYDVEVTDGSGYITTLGVAKYVITQDISK